MTTGFFDKGYARLTQRIAEAANGTILWWRHNFADTGTTHSGHPRTPAKFHIFVERTAVVDPDTRWDHQYRALCDYTFIHHELIFGPLDLLKTKPLKERRCAKCLRRQRQLKTQGKTVLDDIQRRQKEREADV